MSERVFKDARLLEALEFIDDEYIASAARYKMKYEAQPAESPKMTWRTPFKHWRPLVALAACLLLLSVASPLVSYIAEVIRDFNAGAGSGTKEELSESSNTEEVLYLQFTPELEPISKDLIEEIKDAYWVYETLEYAFDREAYINWMVEINGEEYRKEAEQRLESQGLFRYGSIITPYYGIFNDCVVAATIGISAAGGSVYDIAGYRWSYKSTTDLMVYHISSKTMYEIHEAYELGVLKDEDIAEIARRHKIYEKFYKENRNKYPIY